jgi:hypothetical protein
MSLKPPKNPRIPTIEEYRQYVPHDCSTLWRECTDSWRCPGCGRTKFETMRWTRLKRERHQSRWGWKPVWGWRILLVRHHDHQAYEFAGMPGVPRFPDTVVCDHCNSVDYRVKLRYPHMPREFSFSPAEIRQIVTVTPHRRHEIDFSKAEVLYLLSNEKENAK